MYTCIYIYKYIYVHNFLYLRIPIHIIIIHIYYIQFSSCLSQALQGCGLRQVSDSILAQICSFQHTSTRWNTLPGSIRCKVPGSHGIQSWLLSVSCFNIEMEITRQHCQFIGRHYQHIQRLAIESGNDLDWRIGGWGSKSCSLNVRDELLNRFEWLFSGIAFLFPWHVGARNLLHRDAAGLELPRFASQRNI